MKAFALLTAAGFVALLLAVVAGFEEADGTLLLVAAIFLLAAPAVFLQVMIAARSHARSEACVAASPHRPPRAPRVVGLPAAAARQPPRVKAL